MLRRPAGQEEIETPHRSLEDTVGVQETVITDGSTVHGTIQGRNTVRVAGFFEGEISLDGLLWIGQHGEVQGTVTARDMIIEGQMKGDVASSDRVEIRASGRVLGNISCHKLALAEGCFFQGEIKMSEGEGKPLAFVEKRETAKDQGGAGAGT
jgi:cytoskeletal protein CcmA (bactofilin family)